MKKTSLFASVALACAMPFAASAELSLMGYNVTDVPSNTTLSEVNETTSYIGDVTYLTAIQKTDDNSTYSVSLSVDFDGAYNAAARCATLSNSLFESYAEEYSATQGDDSSTLTFTDEYGATLRLEDGCYTSNTLFLTLSSPTEISAPLGDTEEALLYIITTDAPLSSDGDVEQGEPEDGDHKYYGPGPTPVDVEATGSLRPIGKVTQKPAKEGNHKFYGPGPIQPIYKTAEAGISKLRPVGKVTQKPAKEGNHKFFGPGPVQPIYKTAEAGISKLRPVGKVTQKPAKEGNHKRFGPGPVQPIYKTAEAGVSSLRPVGKVTQKPAKEGNHKFYGPGPVKPVNPFGLR